MDIWDYKDGKPVLYGKATLKKEEETLHLKMIGKHFLAIPSYAEMYRTYDNEGNVCKEVQDNAPWICKE